MRTAVIAGATGLIGSQLLELLLDDPRYDIVKALTRKQIQNDHPKLQQIIGDLDALESVADKLNGDDVFCCLGTTMKKAGSKEAFRKVDFDYPLKLAEVIAARGGKQYLLVSALGADKKSSIYYNQVKGEIEEAIVRTGFSTVHIFRPSLLLGPRKEDRSGEDAAKVFYKIFGFLIPAKYQAIESSKVARAMKYYAAQSQDGVQIHESKDLQRF